MKRTFVVTGIIVLLFAGCTGKKHGWKLYSPDSSLCVEFLHTGEGTLSYRAILHNDTMIHLSPMGIVRNDADFSGNLSFVQADPVKHIDQSYVMKSGKKLKCSSHANGYTFHFRSGSKKMCVEFYVANDGMAFRYLFPEKDTARYVITKECTAFSIPSGKAWMAPYDKPTQWSPAYETVYQNGIPVGTPSPYREEGWAFPMLFEINKKWMLITESNTPENYFAAHVNNDSASGIYYVCMPLAAEAAGLGTPEPVSSLPWTTSWRVIILSPSLKGIFESTLVTDVADPCTEGDFSWVRPGRVAWSWWSDPGSPRQYSTQKEFIDLAHEMGWEYVLVDANWNRMEGGTIEDVIRYAAEKGINVWLWYNSGGPHNPVTEAPRDRMYDASAREKEMQWLSQQGVKGIKVDFFGSDKQILNKLSLDILRDAARHKIMVNFHGCTLPKGWSRTWPHLLGMEAVKGEECYMFDSLYPSRAPYLNTIYPFTRNVVGPMDITPVGFTFQRYPHQTTFAHELALAVVCESGVVHFADAAKVYRRLPAGPKEFLKAIPVAWDNSILLEGYPGEYIVVARKKDQDWYIGALNSTDKKKEITIVLDFLGAGTYNALVINDGEKTSSFASYRQTVTASDTLRQTMLPRGGFAIQILR